MLKISLQNAPENAGIYQFFNAQGMLLYVGKAKILKNRIKSYFRFSDPLAPATNLSLRITKMIQEVARVEYIVVPSEHDALILENTLIKQLKPKYNILLRDDKTYPYICIYTKEPFARFEITRKIVHDKSIHYFGPFSGSVKSLLDALYLSFPLVQKKKCAQGKKACLFYQIGRCPAPCEGKIEPFEYAKTIEGALNALKNPRILMAALNEKMTLAAEKLNYEEAATIRDMMGSIEHIAQTTHVELLTLGNYDVFAIECYNQTAIVMRLFIRDGKIVSTSHSFLHHTQGFEKDELYQRALFDFYYAMDSSLAQDILIANSFEEQDSLAEFLSEKFHQKMTISAPQRGKKHSLVALAQENAQQLLTSHLDKNKDSIEESLQTLCDLTSLPKRIEIFDNSHLGGSACVGAMVVWEEKFCKSSYRKYTLHAHDEYAQMKEMLERRIQDFNKEPPPDLWVIDGGKTLLLLAKELLQRANASVDVIAIAKEKIDAKAHRAKGRAQDTLYNILQSFHLPSFDKRLQFVQKLRDEAHRFAHAFHQKKKRHLDLQSDLLKLEGIGEAKLQKLLNYFGSFEAIYKASLEELEILLDKKSAHIVFVYTHSTDIL